MDQSPATAAQQLTLYKQVLFLAVTTGETKTVADLLDGGVSIDTKDDIGRSLLHWAVWVGNVTTMRLLIRRGCDVDSVDGRGLTPLHLAAALGRTKAVRELIRNGASKSIVASNFGTPLHVAAFIGHVDAVVAMLEEGCPSDIVDSDGDTVLHAAAQGGHVEVVRELVGRGCDVNIVKANGCTPLHDAAAHGRTKAVRELIKLGAGKSFVASTFGTPLHQAAYGGHVDTAVAMLEEDCPLDIVDSAGATVLHAAAQGGHVEVVRELVGRGSDVNIVKANGCTPLHTAAAHGRTEAVRELIKLGAGKSFLASTFGTPLHQAAYEGHVDTAVAMLEEGCPSDIVNSGGATVLHAAAQGGHVEVVRELVRRGCDVNAVNRNGCTPLHDAAADGRTEAVRELIKFGAVKSVVAGSCGTPFHQAVTNGHVETAVAMLEEGCPSDIVDSAGANVLHWAAAGGHVEVVRELVGRGCDVNVVKTNGGTPFHAAAAYGRTDTVRELIKFGAAKSVVAGTCGTSLHQAVLNGHVETVVAMLEEGCPLHVGSSDGTTVLHFAAAGGHVELVKELVVRGCDVNAVRADGCTPLHDAAGIGTTEAVRELIKLGAAKSVIAGEFGTPLHQAVLNGHTEAVEALLENEFCETDLSNGVVSSKAQVLEYGVIGTCNSFGQTPVMWAMLCGQVEVFALLISKGGSISDRDTLSLSAFEHCFVGGHANKLNQFCEACGISSSGEGLRGALATLINQGLVDAHKVLCLNAVSGNSLFLEDQFIELVTSDPCAMPTALKGMKQLFVKSGEFLDQLSISDENALNPLHISLLAYKCYKMGFSRVSEMHVIKDHTSFISKLFSHPVLKDTVNEVFPNGLSPLDLAQQFELHHIAALIERAGGRPGVWADVPHDVFSTHGSELFMVTSSLMKLCDSSQGGHEAVKEAVIRFLGGHTVESVVHVADDNWLLKEQLFCQRPDLGDIVKHVLPHIQVRHWKKVGLALGMKKYTLNELGQQFPNDDDCYLETLSCWLEHGSSVTWKTLLDVLGYFETKHTMDELTDKIVQVLGGGNQVPLHLPSPSGCTGHIEETSSMRRAQLSWSPAKWRMASDAIGVPCQRKQSPEGDMQDLPPAKTPPVVNGGAVAVERGPSVCEATPVQVVQKHAEEFLKEMNCKVIATQLRALEFIPERVEYDILQSKSKEEANAHCLKHLREDADERTIREVFRMASEEAGYGRMNAFATSVLRRLQ